VFHHFYCERFVTLGGCHFLSQFHHRPQRRRGWGKTAAATSKETQGVRLYRETMQYKQRYFESNNLKKNYDANTVIVNSVHNVGNRQRDGV